MITLERLETAIPPLEKRELVQLGCRLTRSQQGKCSGSELGSPMMPALRRFRAQEREACQEHIRGAGKNVGVESRGAT